jgi:hypothetical protein
MLLHFVAVKSLLSILLIFGYLGLGRWMGLALSLSRSRKDWALGVDLGFMMEVEWLSKLKLGAWIESRPLYYGP